jgi:hypothetical protein
MLSLVERSADKARHARRTAQSISRSNLGSAVLLSDSGGRFVVRMTDETSSDEKRLPELRPLGWMVRET